MEVMSQRQLRVCRLLQRHVSDVFTLHLIHDPILHDVLWTISEVTISPDLKHARIYVLGNGAEKDPTILKRLNDCVPLFKRQVSPKLQLRFMPNLRFFADTSLDNSSAIDSIIKKLRYSPYDDNPDHNDDTA